MEQSLSPNAKAELSPEQRIAALQAALQTFGEQRDSAMNRCADLAGNLAIAQMKIRELEAQLKEATAPL